MKFPCIECHKEVRPRQDAVACDSCEKWQHRTCNTRWHHRFNRLAGHQSLSFYRLVPALTNEAELVNYELRLVRDGSSTRRIRPVCRQIEEKIKILLDKYSDNELSTSELLSGCSKIYGPQTEHAEATDEILVTRLYVLCDSSGPHAN